VHDLKRANDVKAQCRETSSHYKRNDVQIRKALYGKYGMIQKNRVSQLLHNVSKKIVEHAKANRLAITMENIKGICKLYRAGNGQGNKYRARMNSWSFSMNYSVRYSIRQNGKEYTGLLCQRKRNVIEVLEMWRQIVVRRREPTGAMSFLRAG